MTRVWSIALVVAVMLMAVACSSGDSTPTPTPEATPAGGEPTATATPIPLPSPRPLIPDLGVWVIDAEAGAITKLYEVQDAPSPVTVGPTFSASGAVWVTGEDEVARRYLLDGSVADSVPGVTVLEGPDPSVRVLFAGDGGSLTFESGEAGGGSTVVSEAAVRPFLSPDGRTVAYLEGSDGAGFELWVATADGGTSRLASDVGLCQCDDFVAPSFSPSGDFIAFSDYERPGDDDPMARGTYVARVDGSEQPARVADEPRALLGWLAGEDATVALQVVSTPMLFDATSGATRELLAPGQIARGTARLAADGARVQLWTPDGGTSLVDPIAGMELERWSVRGIATLTPYGPAITLDHPDVNPFPIPGCWGVWIDHPTLPEPECVLGAERALWSPDGSTLALLSDRGPRDRWLEFWTFGGDPLRVLVPPTARLVEWSEDGQHLLVAWPDGT